MDIHIILIGQSMLSNMTGFQDMVGFDISCTLDIFSKTGR